MEKKNILIGYTKWLLKWLLIIAVALSVAQGVGVLYEREIDMIALSCGKSGTYDYQVKKRRDKDTPSHIYAGAYRFGDFTKNSFKKLKRVAKFTSVQGDSYVFNDYEFSNAYLRVLNRVNLEMNFFSFNKHRMKGLKLSCKVIDVDEFYAIVEEETKKRQDKMKI